ncbi:hypothetical protein [Chthonobacter albigriseus]|uniref:hypothetical protein n=1 Tax=Chthonobacter albigriseus TaxID=1683161 RepID=UPI001FCE3274|nr:hypothetical protein [Chthonobacter albigriseus]
MALGFPGFNVARRKAIIVSSLLVGLLPVGAMFPADEARADVPALSSTEIRKAVRGKRIYLQTPLGGEFPLYYKTDGTVDGSGEALGLGRFMAPKDKGKWWIESDMLCQQWQEWYDGKRQCFVLSRLSETTLYWKRDDGLEGEARIGP